MHNNKVINEIVFVKNLNAVGLYLNNYCFFFYLLSNKFKRGHQTIFHVCVYVLVTQCVRVGIVYSDHIKITNNADLLYKKVCLFLYKEKNFFFYNFAFYFFTLKMFCAAAAKRDEDILRMKLFWLFLLLLWLMFVLGAKLY